MCRSQPYLESMGPEMCFLDKYDFIMKQTGGVSCMHDVLLCCLTSTGVSLEPCSGVELRAGGPINSFSLRLRMALKTLYHAQHRPASPSLHLMPFYGGTVVACIAPGGTDRYEHSGSSIYIPEYASSTEHVQGVHQPLPVIEATGGPENRSALLSTIAPQQVSAAPTACKLAVLWVEATQCLRPDRSPA
jgi:hypothetical protein